MSRPVSPYFGGSRFLFVFPHPDDEVFSCLALMRRLREEQADAVIDAVWVAPLPAPARISTRPEGYARYGELLAANFADARVRLEAGVLSRTYDMPIRSREAHLRAREIHSRLTALLAARDYSDLLCCAIEGGHPDHDVACAITAAVARDAGGTVRATEYALYHGGTTGAFVCNSFLEASGDPLLEVELTQADVALKRQLRAAYSAEPSLDSFEVATERFREMHLPPSLVSYERPTLHYETWDSRISRTDVRACLQTWGCR